MYADHPAFEKPENEQSKIWRYTSFIKFLSLISKKALYFSRLDYLGDIFEGSLPAADFEYMNKSIERTAEMWEKMNVEYNAEENKEMYSRMHRDERQTFFVNCWHLNEHESSAMWDIYSKKDEGIAVQSTFKRLRDCFKGFNRTIWIGKVKYIDYGRESIPDNNSLNRILYKRKSFEYEGELRAIIQPLDPGLKVPYHALDAIEKIVQEQGVSKRGIDVDVDLENLIEKIYLSPLAEEWYVELIESILSKYNLDIRVEQSSLSNKSPLF